MARISRREEKWQTCWCCRDQKRASRMVQASAEKLEHTGSAEKEIVATERAVGLTPVLLLPKEKETKPSVKSSRSKGGRESR